MTSRAWIVHAMGMRITAELDPASAPDPAPACILAHGAGGHMADRGMLALAAQFCGRGVHVIRFNFPYSERGSRRPDPMPLLQECIAAVHAVAVDRIDATHWILGGRSMGGRAASMLAASGFGCDGLLLLAYPLHPAGKPEQLRDAHLPRITVPVLCINGTRDPLCRRDLMDAAVEHLASNWRMHWLDGADHSFHVTKASGTTPAQTMDEIGTATIAWLQTIRTA